jgi:hypothetical protein
MIAKIQDEKRIGNQIANLAMEILRFLTTKKCRYRGSKRVITANSPRPNKRREISAWAWSPQILLKTKR